MVEKHELFLMLSKAGIYVDNKSQVDYLYDQIHRAIHDEGIEAYEDGYRDGQMSLTRIEHKS